MNKIVFKEKDIKDYNDPLSCFGIPDSGDVPGYNPEEPTCIDCPSREKCKLLIETKGKAPEFLEAIIKFSGETVKEIPEETSKISEVSSKDEQEITREQVRIEVEEVVKAFDPNLKFNYKSLQNRDKIYVNDTEFFNTTKSTLKFCKIKDGTEIGLTSEEYKDSHTGISVDYEIGMEKINFSINEYLLKKLGRKSVEEDIEVDLNLKDHTEKSEIIIKPQKSEEKISVNESSLKEDEKITYPVERLSIPIEEFQEDHLSDLQINFVIEYPSIKLSGSYFVEDLAKVFSKIKEAVGKL